MVIPLLDLYKYLFLGVTGQFLLIREVILGTLIVFPMLELLRLWNFGLVEPAAVLSPLEQKGESVGVNLISTYLESIPTTA